MDNEVKDWLAAHEKAEFKKHDEVNSRLKALEDQLELLIHAFEQGKGAVTVLKWLAYVAAALWGFAEWAKSHVKF